MRTLHYRSAVTEDVPRPPAGFPNQRWSHGPTRRVSFGTEVAVRIETRTDRSQTNGHAGSENLVKVKGTSMTALDLLKSF